MKQITILTREDFRNWLEKNHITEKKVAIRIYKKHTGKPSPSHREQIEEAICFGWIDTTLKRLDENTYLRTFTQRTEKSNWSDNTQKYARDLIQQGKMTPRGMKYYTLGLKKPTLDFGIPKNPNMPQILNEKLNKNKTLKKKFLNFSPSTKKMLYRWIIRAKLIETKERRVEKILEITKTGKIDLSTQK